MSEHEATATQRTEDLSWVTKILTVDAEERVTVDALVSNPGWLLLHAGMGKGGQTTLTFAWPYGNGSAEAGS